MSETKSPPHDGPGERAFASIESRLSGVQIDLAASTLDLEAAATVAIEVTERVNGPALKARFLALPKKEFDPKHLEELPLLASATRYAAHHCSIIKSTVGEAGLPTILVARAADVESRLQRLCEYHFGDDPEVGPMLIALRAGNGYRDLAGDLIGYARIVRDKREVVKADAKNYRASDVSDALALSKQILEALGAPHGGDAKTWHDHAARAFTLLQKSYDEVRETGLWLERREPERFRHYPSLFAAGRPNLARSAWPKAHRE